MVIVRIHGLDNASERKELREAIRFYATKLKITDYDLVITVRIGSKRLNTGRYWASVGPPTTRKNGVLATTIEMSSQGSLNMYLRNAAHEMTHVKQYLKGHLVYHDNGRTMWKGSFYKDDDTIDELYYTRPWEIEAFGQQHCLYRMYLKTRGRRS